MSIRSARFENFTVFDHAEFTFSPGVNVLIGKNGTGKTHVLKALYGLTEGSRRAYSDIVPVGKTSLRQIVSGVLEKNPTISISKEQGTILSFLQGVFNTELFPAFNSLLKRKRSSASSNDMKFETIIGITNQELAIIAGTKGLGISALPSAPYYTKTSLYIPPREMLSMYPGFIDLYTKYRLPFDYTYYELCRALQGLLLREVPPIFADLAKPLETVLGGRVVLKGNGFVIERDDGELDINLEAEGLRKFAQILQLIANGSIEPGGCLFWDEPEANMNPKLVVVMKDFLIGLAKAGVQVFIATHDYLLCRELSLVSEYGADRELVRFFCLNKEQSTDPVTVESGAVLADLQHNPIVEEFAAHYEREARLFAGTSAATQE